MKMLQIKGRRKAAFFNAQFIMYNAQGLVAELAEATITVVGRFYRLNDRR